MPVLPLSARLFPALQRTARVEATARMDDSKAERPAELVDGVRTNAVDDLPPTDPSEVVDALLDSLTDAELSELEELDTEDIEVLVRQMHLRGLRRQHPRGFLDIRV